MSTCPPWLAGRTSSASGAPSTCSFDSERPTGRTSARATSIPASDGHGRASPHRARPARRSRCAPLRAQRGKSLRRERRSSPSMKLALAAGAPTRACCTHRPPRRGGGALALRPSRGSASVLCSGHLRQRLAITCTDRVIRERKKCKGRCAFVYDRGGIRHSARAMQTFVAFRYERAVASSARPRLRLRQRRKRSGWWRNLA